MNNSYHTVNPIIRIKENELLSKETFDQLIQAPSVDKVGEILKQTVYGKYITADFEHHFEQSLNQELVDTYEELIQIVPNPRLIWLYTMRYTTHNLKFLTKADKMQENYDYLFIPDGFYSIDELKAAIETGESSTLPPTIVRSIQEVREYFEESRILQGIDVIYDRFFLSEQRKIAESLKDAYILENIIASIDLKNLITVARCLMQKRSKGFMSTVISEDGSIEKETLLAFSNKSLSDFIQFISESEYAELLEPALSKDKIDFLRLDVIIDNHLTNTLQSAQTQAFGPLPLLAYLNAKDIEAMNLRLIIVGKRSGFTTDAIKERMRSLYDI